MAKEEEVKATFASMAALNERGDYAGASGLMSTYAVLANEVKELKDKVLQPHAIPLCAFFLVPQL